MKRRRVMPSLDRSTQATSLRRRRFLRIAKFRVRQASVRRLSQNQPDSVPSKYVAVNVPVRARILLLEDSRLTVYTYASHHRDSDSHSEVIPMATALHSGSVTSPRAMPAMGDAAYQSYA